MTYNGLGDVLQPIIVHSGQILKKVEDNFNPMIGFVHTPNGKLNYDAAVAILETVEM